MSLVSDGSFLVSRYDCACSSCLAFIVNKTIFCDPVADIQLEQNVSRVLQCIMSLCSPLTSAFPLVTFGARALEPMTVFESQSTLLIINLVSSENCRVGEWGSKVDLECDSGAFISG